MAFASWSTTAASNATVLGIDIGENCAAANINNAIRELMAELKTAVAPMASGTITAFQQTSAPTGWTKITTSNDVALRVVSGTAGSGGSTGVSAFGGTVSVSGTTGSHALTIAEMPAHQHGDGVTDNNSATFFHGTQSGAGSSRVLNTSSSAGAYEGLTESIGGGGGHTHTFSGSASIGSIKYVDIILASRDA